jgi:hypothetical protein
MSKDTLGERVLALEERLERLERLAYLSYVEMRKVAEYAYLNVRLEEDADTVKRLSGMRGLSDQDALAAGLEFDDIVALKLKARFLTARCRNDALAIAKELADERKRRPVVDEKKRTAA